LKIECPTCHAKLIHKRIDDGFDTHEIDRNGTVIPLGSKSNGGDEVYCSHFPSHVLPEKLVRKVLDLVAEEF